MNNKSPDKKVLHVPQIKVKKTTPSVINKEDDSNSKAKNFVVKSRSIDIKKRYAPTQTNINLNFAENGKEASKDGLMLASDGIRDRMKKCDVINNKNRKSIGASKHKTVQEFVSVFGLDELNLPDRQKNTVGESNEVIGNVINFSVGQGQSFDVGKKWNG